LKGDRHLRHSLQKPISNRLLTIVHNGRACVGDIDDRTVPFEI
jgi:hypothetical protein